MYCIGPYSSRSLWNSFPDSINPIEVFCLLLVDVRFLEAISSIVTDDYMRPEVDVTPPVSFLETICVWFLGGLARQLALQGIYFHL